jgi:lysozyme family protein
MMAQYPHAFEEAINHAMLYEVGGFWNRAHPAVEQGLINTTANRRAVGYVNDPDDRGGETKFGVARNANPDLNITRLTWDQAKAVYYVRYWLAGKCEQLPGRVAVLHFDGCVNHGIKRANMFLQRAAGVSPDGIVGPVTIAKVKQLNPITLCQSICNQREQFYRQIVQNNSSQAKYLNGWLRRINEMRVFSTDPKRSF